MKRRIPILLMAFATAAASCTASGTEDSTSTSGAQPPSIWDLDGHPSDLILLVTEEGAPVLGGDTAAKLPLFAIYRDGTLLAPRGREDAALQHLEQFELSDADKERVNDLVNDIGLPTIDNLVDDSQRGGVFDAFTIVARYRDANGGVHSYRAYGLPRDGATGPARRDGQWPSLATFALGELTSEFYRAGLDGEGEPYVPERLQISWFAPLGDTPATVPWPLDVTPDNPRFVAGNESSCFVLKGDLVEGAIEAVSDLPQRVHVDFNGRTIWLAVRILVPGVESCGPVFGEDGSS